MRPERRFKGRNGTGRPSIAALKTSNPRPRRTLAYCGRKMVLTMGTTLTRQDGERGHQTVFPPSLRYDAKTGEVEEIGLEDDSAAEPAFIEADKLQRRFQVIGAAALLAKH